MINGKGGYVFITEDIKEVLPVLKDSKYITGLKVSEYDKEEIMKEIRFQANSIVPDILTNKAYKVDFVPLMKTADRYNPNE